MGKSLGLYYKRAISVLMVAVLVISLMPSAGFADEPFADRSDNASKGETLDEDGMKELAPSDPTKDFSNAAQGMHQESSAGDDGGTASGEIGSGDLLSVKDGGENNLSKTASADEGEGWSASAQIQTYGWSTVSSTSLTDSLILGTTGERKRLEAIKLSVPGAEGGGIEYRVHAQTYGWMDWQSDGAMAGTESQAKRLEAVQIRLTGSLVQSYDVYYRAHVQSYGWLGWAKNGESAGTEGLAKRVESLEIVIMEKGSEPEDYDACISSFVKEEVSASAQIQTYGWSTVSSTSLTDSLILGTTGERKRLEAIKLSVPGAEGGGIEYRVHAQTYGWMDWQSDGAMAGTESQAKRLEAVQIRLTGSLVQSYDVYYRAHVQSYGWLGWAKNGESAGTEGLAKRVESLEIVIMEKGSEPEDYDALQAASYEAMMSGSAQMQTFGWQSFASPSLDEPLMLGSIGQGKRLEAITLSAPKTEFDGGLEYRVHVQSYGWMDWQSDGAVAGTEGQGKRIEAVEIRLTGILAEKYDIYYRTHVSKVGWMDWAKNGASAGTQQCKVPVEAIQLALAPKDGEAPGETSIPFIDGGSLPVSVSCGSISSGMNDWTEVSSGQVAGSVGQSKALIGIKLSATSDSIKGGISYSAHLAKVGWTSFGADGFPVQNGNPVQAIKISLTGDFSRYFDIYYRAYASGYGWMGWAKNGSPAGSQGLNTNMEAYEVAVVLKGAPAPGTMLNSFSDESGFLKTYLENKKYVAMANQYSSNTNYLIMVDRGNHKVRVFRGLSYDWSLIYSWNCVTGAPGTPTITGSYYTTGFKRTSLSTDSRAIWCTQVWGGYFFHSILESESELGNSLSHGCIRLSYSAALWMYNSIYAGTRVIIYN